MQQFEQGDKVAIVIDPSVHHGMPHPRYHGITGEVIQTQGKAYVVKINDKAKVKHIIALPEHLKKVT
jgi:large subunit ribosomal protein L21e